MHRIVTSFVLLYTLCSSFASAAQINCYCSPGTPTEGGPCVLDPTSSKFITTCPSGGCRYVDYVPALGKPNQGCAVPGKPLCIQYGPGDLGTVGHGCVCTSDLCNGNRSTACTGCFDMSLKCYECEGYGCELGSCYAASNNGEELGAFCLRRHIRDSTGKILISEAFCQFPGQTTTQKMNTCVRSTEYRKDGNGNSVETCVCDHHYCNGATRATKATLLFRFVPVFALATLKAFFL